MGQLTHHWIRHLEKGQVHGIRCDDGRERPPLSDRLILVYIAGSWPSHWSMKIMRLDRRTLVAGLSASLVAPLPARAASVTDGAGRSVPIPTRVERVFPAGPPAAIVLYTAAPALLLGWPRAN